MEAVNLTVAITGASGAILCREALRALDSDARVARIHFVASENSLRVMAEELGISGRTNLLEKLLGAPPNKITQHSDTDIGASIASGSYPSQRHDDPSVLHGNTRNHRQWPRQLLSSPAPPTSL